MSRTAHEVVLALMRDPEIVTRGIIPGPALNSVLVTHGRPHLPIVYRLDVDRAYSKVQECLMLHKSPGFAAFSIWRLKMKFIGQIRVIRVA